MTRYAVVVVNYYDRTPTLVSLHRSPVIAEDEARALARQYHKSYPGRRVISVIDREEANPERRITFGIDI